MVWWLHQRQRKATHIVVCYVHVHVIPCILRIPLLCDVGGAGHCRFVQGVVPRPIAKQIYTGKGRTYPTIYTSTSAECGTVPPLLILCILRYNSILRPASRTLSTPPLLSTNESQPSYMCLFIHVFIYTVVAQMFYCMGERHACVARPSNIDPRTSNRPVASYHTIQ